MISDDNLITLPYLQIGQNVLLNVRNLRTLASLIPKYGGSFMQVFTVLWLHKHKILARQERRPHLKFMLMDTRLAQFDRLYGVNFMQLQVSHIQYCTFLPWGCFSLLNSSWRQHAFTSAFCNCLTCSFIKASLKDCKGFPMLSRTLS